MTAAGLLRAVIFFGALTLLPFVFGQQWVLNSLIFTLMYAGLASAWNLLGGYAGYPSLGHAAFFGVGAYAMPSSSRTASVAAIRPSFYCR